MDLGENTNAGFEPLAFTEPEEKPVISERDRAFVESASGVRTVPFGTGGAPIELQAFDTHRQIAAQKLGMEFFNMGEEAIAEFQERQTYNGIFLDATLVVFLCTQPHSVAKKALRAPTTVRDAALSWASRLGISAGGEKHAHLIEAFGNILNDLMVSASEIDETGLPDGENSLGESSAILPNM